MSKPDYDNPKVEAQWIAEQRDVVEQYLQREEVRHRGVARQPDWFLAPYVSVWRVTSKKNPNAVGWWVVSGDLPTDYLGGDDATDARTALAAFGRRWLEVSGCMLRGEEHPTIKIGREGNRRELGDLLRRRAQILQNWTDDDSMWEWR